ncbi:acyltransferase [Paraburkholderia sp.]|uniref:acyltransferase family protein n=1 Tax=Paraburkholderia sp. TaxID=1926495 RepID=UPI0025EEB697|nr:acyltransferase [Paraburkholderia sp.]
MKNYKLKWVDNTRLLAVLGVLSFHFYLQFGAPRPTLAQLVHTPHDVLMLPFHLGWFADFLFFAISGLGLGMSAARNRKSWTRFYVDRVSKIYIPYWTAIVLMFAYQGIASSIGTWDHLFVIPQTWQGWVKDVLLIPQDPNTAFSTHFWFLPSLLVLYLAFPFAFKMIDRFGVFGFVAVLVLACSAHRMPIDLGPFNYAFMAFAWSPSFVIGAYIGVMLVKHPEQTDRWLMRTLPLGVVCLLVGTWAVMTDGKVWLGHPLLGFGTLSVSGALGRLPWHLPKLTAISFEVYLVHMPFAGWYRHFFGFVTSPKSLIYVFFLVSVWLMGAGVHWVAGAVEARIRGVRKAAQPVSTAAAAVVQG